MEKPIKCRWCDRTFDNEFDLSEHLAMAHYSTRGNLKATYSCFCGKKLTYAAEQPKIMLHLIAHLRQTSDPDLRKRILLEIDTLTRQH